jgi:hypothetical protein
LANLLTAYAASSAVTITLASLASDTTLLAGQESTAIDNTSGLYLDYLVAGEVTTGTSPTAAKQIEVHAVGILDDANWPDVFDGADSNETITSADIKNAICRPLAVLATSSTSNQAYPFGPVSLANAFGGVLPAKVAIFIVHNTGVNLNSTGGNHFVSIKPIYMTSS